MSVTQKEIDTVLRLNEHSANWPSELVELANRIEREGIAPTSVDTLLAEAVAKEREACALACEAVGKGTSLELVCLSFAEEIRARGTK